MATVKERFHLFAIHGHLTEGTPDYARLFRAMTSLNQYHREEGKRQIVVGSARMSGERLVLVLYSGDKEKTLLFYDLRMKSEQNEFTTPTRFQAKKTHVLIDPASRHLLIEVGRGRISADQLAEIIMDQAKKVEEFKTLELSFAPITSEKFVTQIDHFERIQSATVRLLRPNVNWSDSYDALTTIAAESDGGAIDAIVRAKRGDGLSTERGIIPSIKKWVTKALPAIKKASVRGQRHGESGLTVLRLSDYVQQLETQVAVNPETGQPIDTEVEKKMSAFLDKQR